MVYNIYISWGNEVLFIHFIGYYMANITYKNELVNSNYLNTKENNINIF